MKMVMMDGEMKKWKKSRWKRKKAAGQTTGATKKTMKTSTKWHPLS